MHFMRRQVTTRGGGLFRRHEHIAWLGDGRDVLYSMAALAFAAAGPRKDKMVMVVDPPDSRRLLEFGDLRAPLQAGDLEVVGTEVIYGPGELDPRSQEQTMRGILATALSHGYRGVLVISDATRFCAGDDDQFARWLTWEQRADRLQAVEPLSSVCFFDRNRVDSERQGDLTALHPVLGDSERRPAFQFFFDGDAVWLTGSLDVFSSDRFERILDAVAPDATLVIDLREADFVDFRSLRALGRVASAERPVVIRHATPVIRQLPRLLDVDDRHIRFE